MSAAGRKQDTVSRLGGDEFVVLCEGVSSDADVREIAARLVAALAVPFDDGAVVARLSASIGAAVATHPEVRGRDLLRQADAAMYRVKQNGRNGFAVAGDR